MSTYCDKVNPFNFSTFEFHNIHPFLTLSLSLSLSLLAYLLVHVFRFFQMLAYWKGSKVTDVHDMKLAASTK